MNGEEIDLSYEFGAFRLEPATRRLLREGEPLPLTPKAFDTLLFLVQNRERVVEKEEVLRRLWPDTVVEESNLAQNVFTLRKTLGDSPDGARFIATVPRRGYRFVAPVTPARNGVRAAAAGAAATAEALVRPRPEHRFAKALLALVAAGALLLAGYFAGSRKRTAEPEPLGLTRLTFRRGIVRNARFAPDGRTVVYSAQWESYPSQLFLSRPDSPESMTLDEPPADLMAVSSTGELALGLRPTVLAHQMGEFRTLGRAPLTGGTPREVLEHVEAADWSPDGRDLAVVRKLENRIKRLEYPIGHTLLETTAGQCMDRIRVSRDGRFVAFVRCSKPEFSLTVVDAAGREQALWTGRQWVSGFAWSPGGDELWFTTESQGRLPQVRAVDLGGRERVLSQVPGALSDVSREGGVLITTGMRRSGIRGRAPEDGEERELSWLEGSAAVDLSPDGRQLLFGEMMEGGGVSGRIYLRRTDGSPAVHLGDGYPLGLSPDAAWAAVRLYGRTGLTILPTGAGEARTIATGGVNIWRARWFPDGHRLLVAGWITGREGRLYVLDTQRGGLRGVTPEMTGVGAVSPDGKWIATIGDDGHFLYPVDGGDRRPLPGLELDEWPMQWSADGLSLYVRREGDLPLRVLKLDVRTGRKETWKELMPPDRAGVVWVDPLVTPDGRGYVYTYHRLLTDLYLAEGLR